MVKIIDIKFSLLVCLLSVIHAFSIDAQNDTPYPEGYLNEATRVDIRQGNIAYALPKKLHVGKGYTKLWHKFGGKTLILIGSAFAIYSIGVVGNPFSESPFDSWVQMEADELELSMIEVAMSQGYSAIKRYIENCRSCSEIAIYFADYGELIYYIAKGHLPQGQPGELFSSQLPGNGNEARYLLNKAVEFGIVFRKANGTYESLGIIDLPSHDE